MFGRKKTPEDEPVPAPVRAAAVPTAAAAAAPAAAGTAARPAPAAPAAPASPAGAFLTEDTTLHGNLSSQSDVTIAGVVRGNIDARGGVTILADAEVDGDVTGGDVRVAGAVRGRVRAAGRLVISASGSVVGDVHVRALSIEVGGTLQGQCHMGA
jgi:cytoskeletal protein CcmA (bactofilin family)